MKTIIFCEIDLYKSITVEWNIDVGGGDKGYKPKTHEVTGYYLIKVMETLSVGKIYNFYNVSKNRLIFMRY